MVRIRYHWTDMDLIYGQEERLLAWALERVGLEAFRPDAKTIGLEREGELVAVVVFDNFSTCDANMHIASDGTRRWMNKSLLLAAFTYPFVQIGLKRLTGLVPANNEDALKFDENIGFEREGYHPDADISGDLISLGLLRKNCRFIPMEFRK